MTVFPLPLPVAYLLQCIQTAIVICTTRRGSFSRLVYSGWLVFATYQYYAKANELCYDCIQKLYFVLYSFVHTIHCINLLLIIGLDGDTITYRKQPKDHAGIVTRVWSAFEMTFNPRAINTPWQIRSLPAFSSFFGNKPTRGKFLIRQVAVFGWQYLVLDVLIHFAHSCWDEEGRNLSHLDVPDGLLSLQTTMQMVASFYVTRLALDMIHITLSIVFVATYLSAPGDWPPLFGSMWDSYTLRLFWGKHWHQMLRWPFTTICSYTAHVILPTHQPSKYKRHLTVFLVFTLSGVLHQIGSQAMHISLSESNAYIFFAFTALGVFLEEVFHKSIYAKSSTETSQQSTGTVLWKRLIGYVWVLLWLGTSGSLLIYPTVTEAIMNRSVGVPCSMVEKVGLRETGGLIGLSGLALKVIFKTNL